MNAATRNAILKANIDAMKDALEDADIDPSDHALEHAFTVNQETDGTVHATVMFADLPPLISEHEDLQIEEDAIIGTLRLSDSPALMEMRITNHATATLWFHNEDTGQPEQQTLTDEQADIVNQYATAAAFWLTGTGNDALLSDFYDEFPEPFEDKDWAEVAYRAAGELRATLSQAVHQAAELAELLDDMEQQSPAHMVKNAGDSYRRASERLRILDAQVARIPYQPRHPGDDV